MRGFTAVLLITPKVDDEKFVSDSQTADGSVHYRIPLEIEGRFPQRACPQEDYSNANS
jgi:hypothetical protein